METRMIDRRTALKGAGLAGAAAVAALMPAQALADAGDKSSPAGGWEVTLTPGGAPTPTVLVVLTEGGGVLRSHRNDNLQNSLASPSYGSWANLDEDQVIGITVRNFRYANGALVGTTKIRVKATFDDEMNSFSGPLITEFRDLDGNVTGTFNATAFGRRIAVETP